MFWSIDGHAEDTGEPVVVSASRRAEPLWETPASISLLTSDLLDSAGPRVQLSESLVRLPGVFATDRGNYAQDPQISIRGYGARATFGLRGIRLISDGIPSSTPDGQGQASSINLASTDRVEVLRGPMALLYGNASGAVIQSFTRRPAEGGTLQAELYRGSFGMRKDSLQTGIRYKEAEFSLDYNDYAIDGYRRNSAASRQQIQSVYRYQFDESNQLRLVIQRWDQPYAQDPAGLTLEQTRQDPRQAGTNTFERRVRKQTEQNQLGVTFDHRVTETIFLNIYGYGGQRDNLQFLASNTWVGLDRDFRGSGLRLGQQMTDAPFPIRWSLSLERESALERRQGGGALQGEKIGGLTRNEDQASLSQQAVWITQADVAERLSIFWGVRFGRIELTAKDFYLEDRQDGSGRVLYRQSSPVLGFQHWVTPNQMLFVSTGKGYETPTLAELSYQTDPSAAGRILPRFNGSILASQNRQWEAGWRGRASNAHRWELTGFHVLSTNEIVIDRSVAGQSSFRNAPGTERFGLEFSGTSKWSTNWHSYISVSSMQALYRDRVSPTNLSLDGRWLPSVPNGSGLLEMSYRQENDLAALEIRAVGKRFANDTNNLFASAYQTLAFRWQRGYQFGPNRVTLFMRADNLLNRRYVGTLIVNNLSPFEPSPGRAAWFGIRTQLQVL